MAALLVATALSTVGDVVAAVGRLDGAGTDVTPLFLLVTGLIDCAAIFRGGLLGLLPVAREQVVDTVPNAVPVVDLWLDVRRGPGRPRRGAPRRCGRRRRPRSRCPVAEPGPASGSPGR